MLVGPSPRYIDDDGYVGGFSRQDIEELLAALDSNYLGWSAAMAPAIMGNQDRPELGTELANSFCRTDPAIAGHFARVTFLSDNREDLSIVTVPTLILQCSDDIIAPAIEADAARLAQVIGNILNNASKFTPHGGSVTLVLERDGDEAVVRIRDTGMGIAAADLPRVFEMFVQTDAPLESRSGLGIGLTLARHLVERHEGRLTIQSEGRGRGTEAIVRLPALAAPPESVARTGGTSAGSGVTPESKRVLVVDDNHDSANMMAMLLEYVGHDVRTAHDGVRAVVAVAEFQPHVVLLDIGLPGLNGYEVGERIRRAPGIQPVLVAITGWGQADDRRRSAAAGFDHHLVKPVDHDVLMKLVADAPAHVPH